MLKIRFFLIAFLCSVKVIASTTIGISSVFFDYGLYSEYTGAKVTFSVKDEDKKNKWAADLRFTNKIGKKLGMIDGRKLMDPVVKLKYINVDGKYFTEVTRDDFIIEQASYELTPTCFTDTNLISWTLPYEISPSIIRRKVNSLKSDGKFPQYKLFGYDYDVDVANCTTFSCRFLEKMGVNIQGASSLHSYCQSGKGFDFGHFAYYTFGFGFLRDNVQLSYVVNELSKNKHNIYLEYRKNQLVRPVFYKDRIEHVCPTLKGSLK